MCDHALFFLLLAIVSEVIGALATRYSHGFTKLVPSVITVVGVVCAYYFLSLSLKHGIGIGVAYGIWAAIGITLVAGIGAFFFGDQLSKIQILGIFLIIGGVLALALGGNMIAK